LRKARLKPRTNYPHHNSRISRNVVKHLPRFYHCLYSTRPRNYHCLQSVATSSTFSIIHRLYTTINSPKSPPLSASDITLSFGTHTTPRPRFLPMEFQPHTISPASSFSQLSTDQSSPEANLSAGETKPYIYQSNMMQTVPGNFYGGMANGV